jgi:hypothetical protein
MLPLDILVAHSVPNIVKFINTELLTDAAKEAY